MALEASFSAREGAIAWSCPSNIALIKYWGKKPVQLPRNPSLSMTLQEARTITNLRYSYDPGQKRKKPVFRFEGREAPEFESRIVSYLKEMEAHIPLLAQCHLEIDSENTFPHSSGIASSASALGALALCLVELEAEITGTRDSEKFWQKASRLARLGSGSASRSIYPHFALWGEDRHWGNSSDEYAIPVQDFHPGFSKIRDAILIVDSGPKKISSSKGHGFMESHPFAPSRFQQARENLRQLYEAMKEGNWQVFISIVEEEALSLHALMMTGRPGYILMKPESLSIIQLIRDYREDTGHRLGFTLDAGANVHLLYAEADAPQVESFIQSELARYCEKGRIIRDQIGSGPKRTGP